MSDYNRSQTPTNYSSSNQSHIEQSNVHHRTSSDDSEYTPSHPYHTNTPPTQQSTKTITILSGALGRKKELTFHSQVEFEKYLAEHNLRGVKGMIIFCYKVFILYSSN